MSRGALNQKAGSGSHFTHWRQHHTQEAVSSLRRMSTTPVATLLSIMVIAIALALPLGLAKLLDDARGMVGNWKGNAQISLYLKKDLPAAEQTALQQQVQGKAGVGRVELITPAQALADFKASSGYGEAVDLLGSNPLPAVLVVYPVNNNPKQAETLKASLTSLPGVDTAELDMAWVERLSAILEVGNRLLIALGAALALAVLLVVGNTIRLSIESRRDEIRIVKLLGASNAFVRRPFLYMGFWSGLFGGIIALLAVALFIAWLNQPVSELARLYSSQFRLSGLGLANVLTLLAFSTALGLIGAAVAVARHLRQLEP